VLNTYRAFISTWRSVH